MKKLRDLKVGDPIYIFLPSTKTTEAKITNIISAIDDHFTIHWELLDYGVLEFSVINPSKNEYVHIEVCDNLCRKLDVDTYFLVSDKRLLEHLKYVKDYEDFERTENW